MVLGGIIMFDDYNYKETLGCNRAVDELLEKDSIVILDDERITTVNTDGTPIRAYWVKTLVK